MPFDTSTRIDDEYKIIRKLSSGGEGIVFLAKDRVGEKFAVKVSQGTSSLKNEYEKYELLGCTERKNPYFPSIYLHAAHWGYSTLVMTRFKKSLKDMKYEYGNKLSMSCVLKAGISLIEILREIHSTGIVHLDMKPSNIMIGSSGDRKNRLHVIDFGLSRFYEDRSTGQHISNGSTRYFEGTEEFASQRSHALKRKSRRDDMESLGYIMLYLVKGELPWSNIRRRGSGSLSRAIGRMKKNIPLEEMCEGTVGILGYMKKVRRLSFEEEPDYWRMISILRRALANIVGGYPPKYDWE